MSLEESAEQRLRTLIARGRFDDVMGDADEYGVTIHLVGDAICTTEQDGHFAVALFESEVAAHRRWEGLLRKYKAERKAREEAAQEPPEVWDEETEGL